MQRVTLQVGSTPSIADPEDRIVLRLLGDEEPQRDTALTPEEAHQLAAALEAALQRRAAAYLSGMAMR